MIFKEITIQMSLLKRKKEKEEGEEEEEEPHEKNSPTIQLNYIICSI